MSYKCRIYTKDIKNVQDVNDYSVNDKEFKFIADGKGKEYNLNDTEYVIIPTHVFQEMIEQVYANGQDSKAFTKPKKVSRSIADGFEEQMNKPETEAK